MLETGTGAVSCEKYLHDAHPMMLSSVSECKLVSSYYVRSAYRIPLAHQFEVCVQQLTCEAFAA